MDRRLIDYKPELELGSVPAATQKTRDEYGEMSFAAQLLEAQTPGALAVVLKDLVARGGPGAALAEPIVGVLQRAARMVFPLNATRAPGDLKRKAAAIFGMELEGLSPEDKEFELARRFVRLAVDAVARARSRAGQEPGRAVQLALLQAARKHAPGLLRQRARTAPMPQAASAGMWHRQENRIEVLDC
ncbi:hypothetical protein ACFFTM_17105 [Pseudoduganella plicata]|uniref:Uncharacterized protein n=1 Tax=Pseudoduganella plicata TaxID=321984 RepID=A0A4P7B9A0_9BURK|nr:hypothetical protein [Pseudoduganella plicata]QBQ35091.1 hypothetical protein E1742_02070 [Pseudoduganella plicata]GGZ10169.1 hypothetical protein GCM10007388_49590 [Pseudoduganella plicata]